MKINCLVNHKMLLTDSVYRQHISRFHSITFTHWPRDSESYVLMRRCHDWARGQGIEVRGKAFLFARGRPGSREAAIELWDEKLRLMERVTRDFDCCLFEVAAEAWSTQGVSRDAAWSVEPADVWVRKAFEVCGNLTDKPLYYCDFGGYHPQKLSQGVIPSLAEWKAAGVPVTGFSFQLASSLFPRIPLSTIRSVTQQAQAAGLDVEWPENIAWDVVGRWWPVSRKLAGSHVERRQAQIYRDYQTLAVDLGIQRSSVWFPWAGWAYHWRWDKAAGQRQQSDCGLWRQDWSPKPALGAIEPFLRKA